MGKTKKKTPKPRIGLRDEISQWLSDGRPLVNFVRRKLTPQFRKGRDRDQSVLDTIYEFCASKGRLVSFNEGWDDAELAIIQSGYCPTCAFPWDEEEEACCACRRKR